MTIVIKRGRSVLEVQYKIRSNLRLHIRRSARLSAFVILLLANSIAIISPRLSAQTTDAGQIDCGDPASRTAASCQTTTTDSLSQNTGRAESTAQTDSQQVYIDQAGSNTRGQTVNRSDVFFPPDPITDFQRLARSSTGEILPIFGRDLFQKAPSTFAPANRIPITNDYVVGPGDEILLRLWGPESFNSQLTVDTAGSIYIPKVGAVHVAGMRADQLQEQISTEVNHTYRNYGISVNLGQLRSIQVYVVGEARRPGAFTVSALSTVLNALFVSGGPNVQGSMRRIQIRHQNTPPSEFDLYDLVLRGDKTKDIRLQQGDTIFIPAVGPQVALAGSVRHPAIYELRGETTAADLLQLGGGYSSTAKRGSLSIERIDQDLARKALSVSMDAAGSHMLLRDGDVLFVDHISQRYEQSVTIRGNLANPGRFPWHPGMHLSEIIPDAMSLLTSDYWKERNNLGVPTPLFEPLNTGFQKRPSSSPDSMNGSATQNDNQIITANGSAPSSQNTQTPAGASIANLFAQGSQSSTSSGNPSAAVSNLPLPNGNDTETYRMDSLIDPKNSNNFAKNRVQIPAPEIDWSYAVIERLDQRTLKSTLLPFNLGRLVLDHDSSQDSQLQPGDVVTILSQADIPVSLDEQTKFVRLEGEFVSSGVYDVRPGEDLESIVRRAGGLTDKAYLYGSSYLRESARVFQQQRLNEYINSLSADMERSAAVRAASSNSGILDPNMLNEQRTLVSQLRQLRATGRVVLEFQPTSSGAAAIPHIPLENGDVFHVPSRPNTVSVVGAVYGQNVFLFNPGRRLEDYVSLAGKPNRIADRKHAFIIRADGSIFSRERTQGVFSNSFDSSPIYAGDSIVIPEKLIKPTALRNVLDYSQILSSFGLAAAAIAVIH